MSKYDVVYVLTKKGNLAQYLRTYKMFDVFHGNITDEVKAHYETEREISLIAKFRYEKEVVNGIRRTHCLCKIQCPVNPLPVKGEFEAPCAAAVLTFLTENGWTITQKAYSNMFE